VSVFTGDIETGDQFSTPARTITEADIAAFAALTGDSHPQHVDAAWASSSRFGEQIAHGLLVLSFASGSMGFDPEIVVALRRVGDAVFKQPVLIGDSVHVEGRVTDVRPIDEENALVECSWRVLNQDGRLVVKASVELVCRRAPVREPILL
jgi:3-hydroxybutyryl-CoA dehydratase